MRALALFSGGLGSLLATEPVTQQGIAVRALNISIGFSSRSNKSREMRHRAALVGAEFKIIDARNSYLKEVLFDPQYGYGKHFNPCIDCHTFMFKAALAMLKDEGASFIITGEVLGQHPMNQGNDTVAKVRRLVADEEDLVLRPMCTKNLPETKPERKSWVDRAKLEGISGRSRKRRLKMAEEFGVEDFESPGDGCLFTLESFSKKIKDFKEFDNNIQVNNAQLLKCGRHLRLPKGAEMVVGRSELRNELLRALKTSKYGEIKLCNLIGAYSLVNADICERGLNLALKVALTYTKNDPKASYKLGFKEEEFEARAFDDKAKLSGFFIS